MAVGRDHTPTTPQKSEDDEPTQRNINSVEESPRADLKVEAKAANEARRATPYYQHTQASAKRWQVLANTIGPLGQTELATEMRQLARQLRTASRPDGTDEDKQAVLEAEAEMLTRVANLELDAEMTEVVEYLQQAHASVSSGEPPPDAQPTDIEEDQGGE